MSDELERDALAQTCTQKERVFANEYVIDLNGVQSVFRSGCFNVTTYNSATECAARLLGRTRVQALIEVLKAQRLAATNITQESVLHEMKILAQSNQEHYIIDDNGVVKLAEGAPDGAMRAIQTIKRKKTVKEDKEGNITITYDVELKLWDKPAPLKLMGRHVGLFPDKVEVTGKDGQPLETITHIVREIVDAHEKK